jgi:hypothetical protein
VATLPLDSGSTFIRAVFGNGGYRGGFTVGGMRGPTIITSMMGQLGLFREGKINSYFDVIETTKQQSPTRENR